MGHPSNIPLTPQTDERNFPRWQDDAPVNESGCKYPKMLTRLCTEEDRDEWLKRNKRYDQHTGQNYYEEVAPHVGVPIPVVATQKLVNSGLVKMNVGEPVIVRDKDHEIEVIAALGAVGLALPSVKAPIPVARIPIRDLEAENEELRQQLANARAKPSKTVPVKRRGRPKKVRVSQEEVSGEV